MIDVFFRNFMEFLVIAEIITHTSEVYFVDFLEVVVIMSTRKELS